jgi:iron complex outermembrane recepter protein
MKRLLLCSAAAAAFAPGAFAQSANEPASLEEVVVTGVRASIQGAQDVKQNALQIVDAIVAEDIGKLPDNSVAEALQRVTGVQIARARGDANLVLIRGLPNIVTTINGRQIFTTTGRGVALADIPAELLQKVEVFKTQSADQFAGGLVGAINVDLHRPFDFQGSELAVTARGLYSENTDKVDPIVSALASNRWETGAGEFGAMLSVSFQDKHYQEANTFDGTYDLVPPPPNGPTADPIFRPFVIGSIYTLGETQRQSANLSFQWQPNDRGTLYWDSFYVKYDEDYELNFWIPLPGITGDSFTLKPGTNVAQTWHSTDIFTLTSNQAFARESETFQTALGGAWNLTDQLELKSDLAYTRSTADNVGVILDTGFIAPQLQVDFSQGGASNARVLNADGTPFDVTDSSHYWMEQLFDQRDDQEGEDVNFTADLNFKIDSGLFNSLGGGIQIGHRTAENNAALGGGNPRPPGVQIFVDDVEAITGLSGIQAESPNDILDGDRDLWTKQWFVADREFLLNNTSAIRELFGLSPNDPPNEPTRFYEDTEENYAAYVQAKFASQLGALPLDGIFGVRYVRTDSELNGFVGSTVGGTTVFNAVAIDKSDNYVLPSFNVRLKLQDNLDLRFAASKTVVRPDFDDLNPGTFLTAPGPTLPGQGTGGNPNLESPESGNADVTLDWFFQPGSALTGSVFYRDIKDYIQIFNNPEVINGQTFQVSRPRNTDAKLKGLEVSYTQFFDMLPSWLSGFGLQLNYTLVDSNAQTPDLRADPSGATFREADVTNVSHDSYNIIGIYEKYGLSARLAYNWRGKYIESYNQSGAQPPAVVVKDAAQMDFSLGYDVTSRVKLSFDATNILDRPVSNYFGSTSSNDAFLYPRDVRSNDRTLSLGVRVRL